MEEAVNRIAKELKMRADAEFGVQFKVAHANALRIVHTESLSAPEI